MLLCDAVEFVEVVVVIIDVFVDVRVVSFVVDDAFDTLLGALYLYAFEAMLSSMFKKSLK